MKNKLVKYGILSLLVTVILSACGTSNGENEAANSTSENNEAGINVMTSFYPMYEFTKQVAGDRANVDMMISGGEDSHSYEPSAQDVAAVTESDVFVYSSEYMETWVPSLLESINTEDLTVARAADGIHLDHSHDHSEDGGHGHTHSHEESHSHDDSSESESSDPNIQLEGIQGHYHSGDTVTVEAASELDGTFKWEISENGEGFQTVAENAPQFEYELGDSSVDLRVSLVSEDGEVVSSVTETLFVDDHETQDPHIWLDLVYAQDQVDVIRDALIEVDPEGEEVYTQNAEDFKQQLQDLHEQYETELSDAENRTFVVQHEAFGHLANRYNLNQVAIGGLSTEVEPSPSRITEIGEIVDEYNVPVIYFQQGADSSIAQTVAEGTGTETAPLYDLEVLTEDLQEQGMGYIEAMKENLNQLTKSIQ